MGNYYISPEGSDPWNGRLPKTDGMGGGPFRTLERAHGAIRRLKGGRKLDRPVTVMLRGGRYILSRPFVLEPQDSGAEGAAISYVAYPGEEPVLSGGQLKAWMRHLSMCRSPQGWQQHGQMERSE